MSFAFFSDRVIEFLGNEWVRYYRLKPLTTVVTTLAIAGTVAAVIFAIGQNKERALEAKRLSQPSYAEQSRILDSTRVNLSSLIDFIDTQKSQIQATEQALRSMKSEHDKLKPLVEMDRTLVNQLFAQQESRNEQAQIKERWIGLGIGIAGTLLVMLLSALVGYVRKTLKTESAPPSVKQ